MVAAGEPLEVEALGYPLGTNFIYEWSINGERIDNETDTYIPVEEDLQKFISVTVIPDLEGFAAETIEVYLSCLPVFLFGNR